MKVNALALWVFCSGIAMAATNTPPLQLNSSDLVTVQSESIRQTLALTGSLQALNQSRVSAQIDGTVDSVKVRPGDRVKAGQLVAVLDSRQLLLQRAERKAALDSAEVQLAYAAKRRAADLKLHQQQAISNNQWDLTDNNYQVAQAAVQLQRAQLALIQYSIEQSQIKAPINGIVAERLIEPGQRISVQTPLLTLVDLQSIDAVVDVPMTEIGAVAVGQTALLTVTGFDEHWPAQVSRVNPVAQSGSRTVSVYLQLDNPQWRLKAGLYVQGDLLIAEQPNALVLPKTAIQQSASGPRVTLVRAGHLVYQPVRLGLFDARSDRQQILDGVKLGESVVVAASGHWPEGAAVVLPSGSQP